MGTRALASITNTNANVWHVAAANGQHLITLTGLETAILGQARAALIADHNFPPGQWVRRGPGRYAYVP